MKKFCLIIVLFLFSITCAFADYRKYYLFGDNLEVKFVPAENAISGREEQREYKTLLKNEKYIRQENFEKAEKLIPDFIPNIARFTNYYQYHKLYPEALNYALKLSDIDKNNVFSKQEKDYKLGVLYSLNGDYARSNDYLYPYLQTSSNAQFQTAQNYYYLHDLKNAEMYAQKITPKDNNYLTAQELLYNINVSANNPQKAYNYAKNLVKYDTGNAYNYIKVADITTNNDEKLSYYYRAKQIFASQNLTGMIVRINYITAPLEQKRIDEAYKKITTYCKKPDWFKIKSRNENVLSDDFAYWNKRQSDFFETANDCISRYTGSNLAACFKDLNDTQERLDTALAAEQARRVEARQREIQINELVRRNMLLEEQNQIQWSRYNYYPGYYRHPYWW